MENFADYIDGCFEQKTDSEDMYRYKKELLNNMIDTANSLQRSGLKDEKVIFDLTLSQYPEPVEGFREYEKKLEIKRRSKRRHYLNSVLSLAYVLLLTVVYLTYSFLSKNWLHSWLIMEGGVTALIIYHFMRLTVFASKKRFYPISRLLVAFSVMLTAVFAFLVCRTALYIMNSYLIFLGAIGIMFIGDAVFSAVTHQKFAIINYLLYIPAVAAMIYVILGILGAVSWNPGWLIMVASVILDIIVMVIAVVRNKSFKVGEVEDQWKGN